MNTPIPASELIINPDGSVYHLNIRPEQLAPTVITVGDPDRVDMVAAHLGRIDHKINRREFVTRSGLYKGNPLTILSTGMGTDNIEIVMTELDALANINLGTRLINHEHKSLRVVRLGTSGSLQNDIEVDTHLVSATGMGIDSLMCFYDLPQTEEEQAIAQAFQQHIEIPFTPYIATADNQLLACLDASFIRGNTLTCPGFYAPQGRQVRLHPKQNDLVGRYRSFNHGSFRVTNFEMETAGYYSMGRLLGHKMLSVNAIVAHRTKHVYSTQPDRVMNNMIEKVLACLW